MRFSPRWISAFASRGSSERDYSLDALRGLFILGMILVNHPPPGALVYRPLAHVQWHGWTLADTIFPGFLFIVGASIAYSMADRADNGSKGMHARIFRRWALLLALNFVLMNFPYYFAAELHFTGTLALIGWCYLFVALSHLHLAWRTQLALVVAAMMLQWATLSFVPVPGAGPGSLTSEGNAAGYVDRLLLGRIFGKATTGQDEIVLVPMLGAIASTMIGLLAGYWLRGGRELTAQIAGLFAIGLFLFLLGSAWNEALPINKQLWTPSYVLLMAGIALQLLAAIRWLTEHLGYRRWAKPLVVAGSNALFFYVLAQGLQRVLVYGRVQTEGGTVLRLRQYLYQQLVAPWDSGQLGALIYTLGFLAVCYAVILVLYWKRLYIKL
jgi:predicted acyltransferase